MARLTLCLLSVLVSLSGCTAPIVVSKPVPVDRLVYVPIPKLLTKPCPVEAPLNRSGAEVLRVASARKAALMACNGQLEAIGGIQGKGSKP